MMVMGYSTIRGLINLRLTEFRVYMDGLVRVGHRLLNRDC